MSEAGVRVDDEFEGQPDDSVLLPEPELIVQEIELLEDVTQLYLSEIGAKPLLTPAEELATTRLVRAGDFAARQRDSSARLDRGREPRADPCAGEIRSGTRIPLFDLRDVVDTPEYRARHHESVADHSFAGPYRQGNQRCSARHAAS